MTIKDHFSGKNVYVDLNTDSYTVIDDEQEKNYMARKRKKDTLIGIAFNHIYNNKPYVLKTEPPKTKHIKQKTILMTTHEQIIKTISEDNVNLKTKIKDLNKTIKSLKAENKTLKVEVTQLKAQLPVTVDPNSVKNKSDITRRFSTMDIV